MSTQKPYHRYVWDFDRRELVGKFDDMYKAEDGDNFDAWQQSDLTRISRPVAKLLVDRIAYRSVLDLGCGKGALTQMLWKENVDITAIDISPVAIDKARAVYGEKIRFEVGDIVEFMAQTTAHYDLVFTAELLSYVERWRDVIALAAQRATYFYCGLYLPENPIGFVKSGAELRAEIAKYFDIVHDVEIHTGNTHLILSRRKP